MYVACKCLLRIKRGPQRWLVFMEVDLQQKISYITALTFFSQNTFIHVDKSLCVETICVVMKREQILAWSTDSWETRRVGSCSVPEGCKIAHQPSCFPPASLHSHSFRVANFSLALDPLSTQYAILIRSYCMHHLHVTMTTLSLLSAEKWLDYALKWQITQCGNMTN